MSTADGLIKISYPVEAGSWDGASGENIWVQLVELVDMDPPHRTIATVESIPFSTRTLSCGDKILLKYEKRENRVVFVSIVERGGHSTCQIYVEKENLDASAMLKRMKVIGCGWEGGQHGSGKIYALDIPPEVDFDETFDFLKNGQDEGHWTFQTGYIGHPEKDQSASPSS